MHKSEYIEYLKSDDWKERRKILLEQAGWICYYCSGKAVLIHHLNYEHLGEEVLGEDVEASCKDCHDEIHERGEYGYGEYTAYC